jgi:hypothetical protein
MSVQEMSRRLEEMEKRLSVLEDIKAIERLQTEYADFLQEGNYDKAEDLVTEDALYTAAGPTKTGKEEIVNLYIRLCTLSRAGLTWNTGR